MTERRPDDRQGQTLWDLAARLDGASDDIDTLITLAWQLYHELCTVKGAPPSNDFHAAMMLFEMRLKEARGR